MKFLSQFLLGLVIGARLAAAVGIDFDFIKRQAFSLSSSTVESVETSTTASVPTEITSIISAVPSTSAEVSSLAVPPPPPPLSVPPVETTSSEVASVLPPPESTTLVIPTPTLPPSTSTTAEATAPVPTPGGGGGDTGGGFGKACGAGYTYCGYILQGDGLGYKNETIIQSYCNTGGNCVGGVPATDWANALFICLSDGVLTLACACGGGPCLNPSTDHIGRCSKPCGYCSFA